MKPLPLLAVAFLLAGCVSGSTAGPEPDIGTPASPADEIGLSSPLLIVDHDIDLVGLEWDVMCRNGGGPALERTDALIAPGVDHLDVEVTAAPTYTSLQVGYSLDNGTVTWLPPVFAGSTRQVIPVPSSAVERVDVRWVFFYQLNLPGVPQDCYTGAGSGARSIRIEAMPP